MQSSSQVSTTHRSRTGLFPFAPPLIRDLSYYEPQARLNGEGRVGRSVALCCCGQSKPRTIRTESAANSASSPQVYSQIASCRPMPTVFIRDTRRLSYSTDPGSADAFPPPSHRAVAGRCRLRLRPFTKKPFPAPSSPRPGVTASDDRLVVRAARPSPPTPNPLHLLTA